jgi:TorA maturation chaperone TorD
MGKGGEVREKVEGQQYTREVLHPWGQQFTSWVKNTNHEGMYLQFIKSAKHLPQSPLTGQF